MISALTELEKLKPAVQEKLQELHNKQIYQQNKQKNPSQNDLLASSVRWPAIKQNFNDHSTEKVQVMHLVSVIRCCISLSLLRCWNMCLMFYVSLIKWSWGSSKIFLWTAYCSSPQLIKFLLLKIYGENFYSLFYIWQRQQLVASKFGNHGPNAPSLTKPVEEHLNRM